MSKLLDDYTAADSDAFAEGIHREAEGYWKPIYPDEVGRALKHVEANYNYKVLTGTVANYRIYPSTVSPGSTGAQVEDFTGDDGKVLTLEYDGTEGWYWTLSQGGTGGGPSGPKGDKGEAGNDSTVAGPSGPSGPDGTNYWQAGTQGSEIYYNADNVGIGTTNPSETLHVVGNTYIEGQAWSDMSSGSTTVDWDNGNSATVQLTVGTTAITLSNPQEGATYFLKLITAAGGGASDEVTWSIGGATIKWPGDEYTPSSGASEIDSVVLFYDGSGYLANASLNYS